jgi:putative transposase
MMIGRIRGLSKEGYIYVWADGIYFNIRNDHAKQGILVIIGVTIRDNKDLLAIENGSRETDKCHRNSA